MMQTQEAVSEKIRPYRGLRPFTQAESIFFYGRQADTELVAAHLLTSRLTVFFGSSGVGKSSLLMAGAIPYLEKSENTDLFVVSDWSDQSFLENLKKEICQHFWHNEENKHLKLSEIFKKAEKISNSTIAIIFDQFEDYFEYQKENSQFESELAITVNTFELNVNFLISMRDDQLAQLDRLTKRIPNILDNTYRLRHLDESAARDAIKKPLAAYKNKLQSTVGPVSIEPALVDELITQCSPKASTYPNESETNRIEIEASVLQLTLDQLWKEEAKSKSDVIRLATLKKMGEVNNIMECHLNQKLKSLTTKQRAFCAILFDRIVTPTGRKLAYSRTDLFKTLEIDKHALNKLLSLLTQGESRILRTLPPAAGEHENNPRYELFHDKLAEAALKWLSAYKSRVSVIKTRKRSLVVVSAIVCLIIVKHYYDVWLNSPYAYLTDLSNNKQYPVSHEVTLISRYTKDKQPDNYVPISPSRIVSRIHFLINRNTDNDTAEASDVRSSYGTMINADFLPYGQIHTLQENDLISLAGNQNFRYIPVDKSIFPAPPKRQDPAPLPGQWGIFIDSDRKKIIALTDDKYYLSYTSNSGYLLSKIQTENTLAEIGIDNRKFVDKNNNLIEAIYITDLQDSTSLYKRTKRSRYNAYDYDVDLITPDTNEFLGIRIEARPIVLHYDDHYFQIVSVPQK